MRVRKYRQLDQTQVGLFPQREDQAMRLRHQSNPAFALKIDARVGWRGDDKRAEDPRGEEKQRHPCQLVADAHTFTFAADTYIR